MKNAGVSIRVAVAGSGKTRSLVDLVKEIIIEDDDPGSLILLSTYTREAAGVIKRRVMESTASEHLGRRLAVGTMHSIAKNIVNRDRIVRGLGPLNFVGDGRAPFRMAEALGNIMRKVEGVHDALKPAGAPTDVFALARRIAPLLEILPVGAPYDGATLRPFFRSEAVADFMAAGLTEWRSLCANAPVMDIQRIIPDAISAIRNGGDRGVRISPRHVIIDEGQDISPVQIEFIDALCRDAESLHLVGDPDQSIFRFRGGGQLPFTDMPEYLNMSRHLRGQVSMLPSLQRSYRCPACVGQASLSLLNHTNSGPGAPIVGHPDGAISTAWALTDAEEATQIAHCLSQVPPRDLGQVAVLGRTHQTIEPFFFQLIAEQVPARMMRADDPLAKVIMERISSWLRISLSPQDIEAGKSILRVRALLPGIGPATIKKVERLLSARESVYRTLEGIVAMPGIRKPQAEVIHHMADALRDGTTVLRQDPTLVGWLDWLIENHKTMIVPENTDPDEGLRVLSFASRLARACGSATRFLDAANETPSVSHVAVGTFHASKGAEWKSVFLVGLSRRNIEMLRERRNDNLFADGVLDAGEDGERRLLHVAMTRASRSVMLTWAGGPDNVSRYVLETSLPIADRPGIHYRHEDSPAHLAPPKLAAQQLVLF